MYKRTVYSLYLLLFSFSFLQADSSKIEVPLSQKGERHIVVVTASYNNAKYCLRNLDSVFEQKYENYHIIYVNDCSTDSTLATVKNHIQKRGMQEHVIIVDNDERRGALHNQYNAIHEYCVDTDLVVILDGDDWLFGNDVFSYLNVVYKNPKIWLTYGQFTQYPSGDRGWCIDMPTAVVKNNSFRRFSHLPSHLRTFYAGLFKQIHKEDLMYEGNFFRMTSDVAIMMPMIEMAREGHFKFIEKVLLVWNGKNDLNDHKLIGGLQRNLDVVIRSKSRYHTIETPFLTVPVA